MSGASPILVTGAAGFIGSKVCNYLINRNDIVIGLDNLNDYYDVNLKESRLCQLKDKNSFIFVRMDLEDRKGISELFNALIRPRCSPRRSGRCALLPPEPPRLH